MQGSWSDKVGDAEGDGRGRIKKEKKNEKSEWTEGDGYVEKEREVA